MSENLENTSFMRSLCMGKIEEGILFPFPKMKPEEQETLRTMRESFQTWLGNKEKDFRKWDVDAHLPDEFVQEL